MPRPKKQTSDVQQRQSNRLVAQQPRIVDEAAKRKRIQRQLETLEKDNFQEDPHANITWHKAAPKFDDELVFAGRDEGKKKKRKLSPNKVSGAEQATKKGKKLIASLTKTRFRKNFAQLVEEHERKWDEEQKLNASKRGGGDKEGSALPFLRYSQVTAPPSRFPTLKFCAVCGLAAKYTCTRCEARYCSIPCRDTHVDTRCLKWTI